MAGEYRNGARLIDYRLPWGDEAEQHVQLVELLRRLPSEKIMVNDEAPAYRDADRLAWLLAQAEYLDEGSIRSLVLTQRPWSLPEELRANMLVKIWVGPLTSQSRNFFQIENMQAAVPMVDEATGPYRLNVTDGGEYQHTNPPVPAEYA